MRSRSAPSFCRLDEQCNSAEATGDQGHSGQLPFHSDLSVKAADNKEVSLCLTKAATRRNLLGGFATNKKENVSPNRRVSVAIGVHFDLR